MCPRGPWTKAETTRVTTAGSQGTLGRPQRPHCYCIAIWGRDGGFAMKYCQREIPMAGRMGQDRRQPNRCVKQTKGYTALSLLFQNPQNIDPECCFLEGIISENCTYFLFSVSICYPSPPWIP